MQDIINVYLNQFLLSLIVSINTYASEVAPFVKINLIEDMTVTKVIDGDTIEVYQNGEIEKIRLIGVNTPETLDPRKEVECYGLESSIFLKKELEGKTVTLETDPSQQNIDTYGRLLRYVFLDEQNINQKIIEEGYGFEYTYKTPYKYQKEFKLAEKTAKENQKGLWYKENCNY